MRRRNLQVWGGKNRFRGLGSVWHSGYPKESRNTARNILPSVVPERRQCKLERLRASIIVLQSTVRGTDVMDFEAGRAQNEDRLHLV